MRPNFFVNTPDILHAYLQYGGPAAFKIRAVLAATGSPSWGVYAGYELFEHVAVQPGQRGVPRLGEVPDPGPRLGRRRGRGPHARAVPHAAQRDPPRAPRPAAAAQRHDPQQRRRERPGLLEVSAQRRRAERHRDRRSSTSTRTGPARPPSTSTCRRSGCGWHDTLRRPRRDHRRRLELGRAQLRAPRPRPRARPRPDREEVLMAAKKASADLDPELDEGTVLETSPPPDTDPFPDQEGSTPDWFKTAVFYEVLVRSFRDSNGDGTGDFKGLIEKLDYLQWLGVDCLWIPPFFTSPLRDGGYDVADYTDILPEIGTVEDFHDFLDEAHKRGIRVIIDFVMNHTSDAAPVVPGQPRSDPDGPVRRLLRLVRHRRALRGRPDHLRRHRAVELDLGPGPPAVLLAPVLLPPARPQLRQPGGARGDARGDVVLARHGPRRLPARRGALPLRAPGHQRREPPGDPRVPPQGPQVRRRQVPRPGAARRGQPVAGRRRRLLRRLRRRRRRVPHVLPLPGDAAHLHGGPPRVALPDLGDPRADAADPRRLPVGHLPAQPRRADPRDGHRRGPRLHVGRVRQGPADEGQHRHPPPAGSAARQRHQPDRAVHRAAALAARLAGPLLRRRDRDGRQHLAR